jgi:glycosyltransferase involved in cell wall biosynthesis
MPPARVSSRPAAASPPRPGAGRFARRRPRQGRHRRGLVLVHDYLTQMGGAERVMADLVRHWPEAEVRTLLYAPATTFDEFRQVPVRTSALQPLAGSVSHRALFPLMPAALRSLEVRHADLVISSSSGWAHAVRVPEGVPHICYCHSPARWLHSGRRYIHRARAEVALGPVLAALRRWDTRAAAGPTLYVANSRNVRARIAQLYGREAVVLHPPVDVHRFRPTPIPADGYLLVLSRLLGYKRIDLAIAAAAAVGRPVVVAGEGPERARLEQLAHPGVTFAGRVSDHALGRLFAGASALLQCGEEDFGIAVLEANAAGRPVVALGRGGALETVRPDETGVLFAEATVPAAAAAVQRALAREWDPERLAVHARAFAPDRFFAGFERIIERHVAERRAGSCASST